MTLYYFTIFHMLIGSFFNFFFPLNIHRMSAISKEGLCVYFPFHNNRVVASQLENLQENFLIKNNFYVLMFAVWMSNKKILKRRVV